jgi:low temperature requirement protein LtrA
LLAGGFWIWGGVEGGSTQAVAWVIALAIDCAGPLLYYYVPGLGASSTTDWKVDGAHMAERCALFVIIALGESILVTGATAASLPATMQGVCAFIFSFLGSVAMWWIYFNIGAERGSRQFASAEDTGRIGRAVYTLLPHSDRPGIVVCAVADENHHHASRRARGPGVGVRVAGWPGALSRRQHLLQARQREVLPVVTPGGTGLLLVLAPFAMLMTPLALGAATTAALIIVAAWETRSFRR